MLVAKVFSIFFICLLAACGNSVLQSENTNQTQTKETPKLSLKMERFGCYGRCPIYDLTIQPDGNVIFEGKFWTKVKGTAEGKITQEQLKQLIDEIEKAKFFSLDNNYNWDSKNCPELATDSPGINLTIKLNGKEKTIDHYHGCNEKDSANQNKDWTEKIFPQQLYKLENKIDEIVETKRWIGEEE
jgi:Domain of unknown function (DUF6438)